MVEAQMGIPEEIVEDLSVPFGVSNCLLFFLLLFQVYG
jgi:hypothetical protein